MDSLRTFLDMGGYAAFVWPCFIVSAVVLVAVLVASRRTAARNQATLDTLRAAGAAESDNDGRAAAGETLP